MLTNQNLIPATIILFVFQMESCMCVSGHEGCINMIENGIVGDGKGSYD